MKFAVERVALGLMFGIVALFVLMAATPKPEPSAVGRYQLAIGKFTTMDTKTGTATSPDGVFKIDTITGHVEMLHTTHHPDTGVRVRWVSMAADK